MSKVGLWPGPGLGEQPLAGIATTPVGGSGMLARMSAPPVRKRAPGLAPYVVPCQGSSSASQEPLMAATRTPGMTLSADGRFFIDKRYRGIRIGMRVGPVTQEQA
jgi:hypothetical protein